MKREEQRSTKDACRLATLLHVAQRVLAASTLAYVTACGPDVEPGSTWMLGVFSSGVPDGATSSPGVIQYHVSEVEDPKAGGEARSVLVLETNTGGVYAQRERTWKRRGRDALVMLPGADESPANADIAEWLVTRVGECGPHEVDGVHSPSGINVHGAWHRGEVCSRPASHCNPDCPIEDPAPYELYWCDGPPAPCGDAASTSD